jgi:hypothetical protein
MTVAERPVPAGEGEGAYVVGGATAALVLGDFSKSPCFLPFMGS